MEQEATAPDRLEEMTRYQEDQREDDAHHHQGDEEAKEVFPIFAGQKGEPGGHKAVESTGDRYGNNCGEQAEQATYCPSPHSTEKAEDKYQDYYYIYPHGYLTILMDATAHSSCYFILYPGVSQ